MVKGNLACNYTIDEASKVEISESPLKWCVVTLSDIISRGKRLEASVFDAEAKQARHIIMQGKYKAKMLCGEKCISSSYTCGRFKRIWVDKSEYPIYQPSTILDIKPTPDGYISKLTKTNIEALRVHRGQVLMTCSGTIGHISYVSDILDDLIFSHDLLRISCNDIKDAGYVYAYLKSKTGNKILLTNSYGAVITHIEAEHLETVPIPDAPMNLRHRISALIERSYSLRDESNTLIDEATRLLVEELKLPPLSKMKQDNVPVETFSIKLSDMNTRLDCSYHVPIVNAIIKHLHSHAAEVTTIGDCRISKKVILAGVFKRIYVDEDYGYPFLGGREITQLNPKVEKYLSRSIHKKRYEKELKVSENDILVTDRGSVGVVSLVPKHWKDYAVSQNVLKLVPANNHISGYVYIYLNSDFGRCLIKRQTYGSVVDMIDNNSLSSVEIPLLKNNEIQKRINDIALEANAKRYQAYEMEQEALRIMDDEVIYAK